MKTPAFVNKLLWLPLLAVGFVLQPAQAADDPAAGKAIVAALKPFVESRSLAGAVVLVADKDKVLCLESVGYADIEDNQLMTNNLLFWIASMSKPITGAALMLLVDEGKVKLDDPVENYLPEFKGQWLIVEQDKEHQVLKKPKSPITVRQVLNHTSGMTLRTALEQPTLDRAPLQDAVRGYAMMPLLTEPGTKWQYNNPGINTAGRIVEVVSGMSFEAFLEKRLFGPLGMKDTTFWPTKEQLKRLVTTYKPNSAKTGLERTTITALKYPLDGPGRYAFPGGGLFSTAGDVGRFCQMVLAGGVFEGKRILSEAAVKEMTSRQTPSNMKESYGLGWATTGASFGHGGAYATNLNIDAKRGLITVFMVQHNGFAGNGAQSLAAFRKAAEDRFGKGN